jgi:hypothetical protein
MDVCCDCCVLSGRGLCDEPITRPEKSYRLWCVAVCDLKSSEMRRPWHTGGCSAPLPPKYIISTTVALIGVNGEYRTAVLQRHTVDWGKYKYSSNNIFFCCGAATQRRSWPPHSWVFLDHTQRRTTVGRTTLDEWSAIRRDLYLTAQTLTTYKHPCPTMGFKPTISAGERPQTYALDSAATGTGSNNKIIILIKL